MAEMRGTEVDVDLHNDLSALVQEHTPSVMSEYPADSFGRLFWEQQQKACVKDRRRPTTDKVVLVLASFVKWFL